MSSETAQIVLAAIAGIGFIAWLAGLQFLFSSARVGRNDTAATGDFSEPPPDNWMVGSAEVDGQPAVLAKKAAALLVKQAPGPFGPIKIMEASDNRLAFERVGPAAGNMQGQWLRRGEMRFTAIDGKRTRIDYAIERSPLRWLLWLGGLFLVLGLIALVVGAWLIATLVVPSPDPAVRSQAIQMVQAIHFLWPPFLMGGLYRRGIRSVRATFEALVHNLPYAE
jgi:hypothetical protein